MSSNNTLKEQKICWRHEQKNIAKQVKIYQTYHDERILQLYNDMICHHKHYLIPNNNTNNDVNNYDDNYKYQSSSDCNNYTNNKHNNNNNNDRHIIPNNHRFLIEPIITILNPLMTITTNNNNDNNNNNEIEHSNDSATIADNDNSNKNKLTEKRRLLIGGVDVSFPINNDDDNSNDNNNEAVAVYVIIDVTDKYDMKLIYRDCIYYIPTVDYIPNYLMFREIQPFITLIKKQILLQPLLTPYCILVDGNGILHKRYSGVACAIGVMMNIPTIGVSKTFYHMNHTWTNDIIRNGMKQSLQNIHEYYYINSKEHVVEQHRQQHNHDIIQILWDFLPIGPTVPPTTTCTVPTTTKECHHDDDDNNHNNNNEIEKKIDIETILQDLSNITNGIAIPLIYDINHRSDICNNSSNSSLSSSSDYDDDDHIEVTKSWYDNTIPTSPTKSDDEKKNGIIIIGCVLLGHGGYRLRKKNKNMNGKVIKQERGAKNPIYISIGHQISLHHAIEICTYTSLYTRIPEPIRQADLIGRELLRNKKE